MPDDPFLQEPKIPQKHTEKNPILSNLGRPLPFGPDSLRYKGPARLVPREERGTHPTLAETSLRHWEEQLAADVDSLARLEEWEKNLQAVAETKAVEEAQLRMMSAMHKFVAAVEKAAPLSVKRLARLKDAVVKANTDEKNRRDALRTAEAEVEAAYRVALKEVAAEAYTSGLTALATEVYETALGMAEERRRAAEADRAAALAPMVEVVARAVSSAAIAINEFMRAAQRANLPTEELVELRKALFETDANQERAWGRAKNAENRRNDARRVVGSQTILIEGSKGRVARSRQHIEAFRVAWDAREEEDRIRHIARINLLKKGLVIAGISIISAVFLALALAGTYVLNAHVFAGLIGELGGVGTVAILLVFIYAIQKLKKPGFIILQMLVGVGIAVTIIEYQTKFFSSATLLHAMHVTRIGWLAPIGIGWVSGIALALVLIGCMGYRVYHTRNASMQSDAPSIEEPPPALGYEEELPPPPQNGDVYAQGPLVADPEHRVSPAPDLPLSGGNIEAGEENEENEAKEEKIQERPDEDLAQAEAKWALNVARYNFREAVQNGDRQEIDAAEAKLKEAFKFMAQRTPPAEIPAREVISGGELTAISASPDHTAPGQR